VAGDSGVRLRRRLHGSRRRRLPLSGGKNAFSPTTARLGGATERVDLVVVVDIVVVLVAVPEVAVVVVVQQGEIVVGEGAVVVALVVIILR